MEMDQGSSYWGVLKVAVALHLSLHDLIDESPKMVRHTLQDEANILRS